MSEFYASGEFLDRKQLFIKYYSLISVITLQAGKVEYTANKLRRYSGFGIESQVSYLKSYHQKLMDYKENIRTEYNSLVKIVDTINDSERKAVGILGNISDEYKLNGYNAVGDVKKSSNTKFSEIFSGILEVFSELLGGLDNLADGCKELAEYLARNFKDIFKGLPEGMCEFFEEVLAPIADFYNVLNSIMQITSFYADNIISGSDIFGMGKYTVSAIESFLKIVDTYSDVKLLPKFLKGSKYINPKDYIGVADTLKITDNLNIGTFTQYLPVAGVVFETLFSGAKTYDKVSQDGVIDAKDWAEIGIDASMDGLIACGEALLCIACPPAAIGVAIFEIGNIVAEKIGGQSLKDMAKDKIKKSAQYLGQQLGKLMGRAVPA